MHTAEHLLNGEIARRYGCGRAFSAHIERKKSKLDYHIERALTPEELKALEDYINEIVAENVEVTEEFITQKVPHWLVHPTFVKENVGDAAVRTR